MEIFPSPRFKVQKKCIQRAFDIFLIKQVNTRIWKLPRRRSKDAENFVNGHLKIIIIKKNIKYHTQPARTVGGFWGAFIPLEGPGGSVPRMPPWAVPSFGRRWVTWVGLSWVAAMGLCCRRCSRSGAGTWLQRGPPRGWIGVSKGPGLVVGLQLFGKGSGHVLVVVSPHPSRHSSGGISAPFQIDRRGNNNYYNNNKEKKKKQKKPNNNKKTMKNNNERIEMAGFQSRERRMCLQCAPGEPSAAVIELSSRPHGAPGPAASGAVPAVTNAFSQKKPFPSSIINLLLLFFPFFFFFLNFFNIKVHVKIFET